MSSKRGQKRAVAAGQPDGRLSDEEGSDDVESESDDGLDDSDDGLDGMEPDDEGPRGRESHHDAPKHNHLLLRPAPKRQRDALYVMPTADEMKQLRNTEALFHSNLLRMEVEEVLREAKHDFTSPGKRAKKLEATLHALKAALEGLSPRKLTANAAAGSGSAKQQHPGLPLKHHTRKELSATLAFAPPARVELVGSMLLRTTPKLGKGGAGGLNADLALHLPASCLEPKDYLNHRYFDKRKLFLGEIARQLAASPAHAAAFGAPMLRCFQQDPTKPILVLRPPALKGAEIRLWPALAPEAFRRELLAPARANVRHGRDAMPAGAAAAAAAAAARRGAGGRQTLGQAPTPHYNNAVLEDMSFGAALRALHAASAACPALSEGALLAKLWLRQRVRAGQPAQADGFSGFAIAALLAYLVASRKLAKHMDAAQLFRGLVEWLAATDLTEEALVWPTGEEEVARFAAGLEVAGGAGGGGADVQVGCTDEAVTAAAVVATVGEAAKAARGAFGGMVLLLDPLGVGVNLGGRTSASACKELSAAAAAAAAALSAASGGGAAASSGTASMAGAGSGGARALFVDRADPWGGSFDSYMRVPALPEPLRTGNGGEEDEEEDEDEDEDEEEDEQGGDGGALSMAEADRLCDLTPEQHWLSHVTEMSTRALGDRALLVRPIVAPLADWSPAEPAPCGGGGGGGGGGSSGAWATREVVLAMRLSADNAARMVDRGPSPEAKKEARRFRSFWGAKCELRRFRDGQIVESVVWQGAKGYRHLIVERVVRHILATHAPSSRLWLGHPGAGGREAGGVVGVGPSVVHGSGGQLHGLLLSGDATEGLKPKAAAKAAAAARAMCPEMEDAVPQLCTAFDKLVKVIKSLHAPPDHPSVRRDAWETLLPLPVTGVQAVSAPFRYTALWPPARHPLAAMEEAEAAELMRHANAAAAGGHRGAWRVGRNVEPVVALVRFEGSSSWPDDLRALRETKLAFCLQIAKCLEAVAAASACAPVRASVVVAGADPTNPAAGRDGYLDVLFGGFAFRLLLVCPREKALLRAYAAGRSPRAQLPGIADRGGDDAMVPAALARVELDAMEREHEMGPMLHGALHALQLRHPAFAPTVRLAQRWVHAQMLSAHLDGRAVELLVAHGFTSSAAAGAGAALAAAVAAGGGGAAGAAAGGAAAERAPATSAAGFLRFLALLAQWDWRGEPLIVELQQEGAAGAASVAGSATAAVVGARIRKQFEAERKAGTGPALFLTAPLRAEMVLTAGQRAQEALLRPEERAAQGAEAVALAELQAAEEAAKDPVLSAAAAAGAAAMQRSAGQDQPWWTRARPEPVVLGRLVECARLSLRTLRGWLGAPDACALPQPQQQQQQQAATVAKSSKAVGSGPLAGDGWQKAFMCDDGSFLDARVVLQADILPLASGAGRRLHSKSADRLRGSKRFRIPLYKNLLSLAAAGGGGGATEVLVGFEPVARFLETLEERFGHLAIFFNDAFSGCAIGIVWRPAAFFPRVFQATNAANVLLTGAEIKTDQARAPKPTTVPNVGEVLAEITRLGKGLVERVEVL